MTYAHHVRHRQQSEPQERQEPRYASPPQQQVVYMDRPSRRDVSVKNVTVPLVLVITGAASIIFATYIITSNMAEIKFGIKEMQSSLVSYTTKSGDQISRLEKEMENIRLNGWSSRDHALWCSQEEVQNPSWRCVQTGAVPSAQQQREPWGSLPRPKQDE